MKTEEYKDRTRKQEIRIPYITCALALISSLIFLLKAIITEEHMMAIISLLIFISASILGATGVLEEIKYILKNEKNERK